ncbi:MAG TPA: hypothetical protein VFA86_06510 [Gammaproteobacteria bacterium]|nr:hypothetical protein [Gammaproteobacteria bacterium]
MNAIRTDRARDVTRVTLPQQLLLEQMHKHPGTYPLDPREVRTARILELRGLIRITDDPHGAYSYAEWDEEAHAEWIRAQEVEV